MSRIELSETLAALIAGVDVPDAVGIVISEATVELALQITMASRAGRLAVMAAPPTTTIQTGFDPVIHRARVRAAWVPDQPSARPQEPEGEPHAAGR